MFMTTHNTNTATTNNTQYEIIPGHKYACNQIIQTEYEWVKNEIIVYLA